MAKIKKGKLTIEDALVPVEEQPYEIPENWCWTRLEYYIDYATDYVANGSFASLRENVKTYKDENYALMVKTQDFSNGFSSDLTYTDKHGYEFLAKSELHGGELLLSNIGASIGKVFRVPFMDRKMTLAPNTIMLKTRNNSDVENDFLKYYFLSPIGNHLLNDITTGSATPKFNKTELKKLPLPLPTMQEQKRIVEQIENLFSKLDEAKEKVQSVVDSKEFTITSLLYQAFDGKLTNSWRKANNIINVWEDTTIGELFSHSAGKALKKDNTEGTLHRYITTSNLYWGRFELTEVREMYYRDNELDKCTATKGDLLICNGGDVGRAAVWDFDYDICLQNHVSRLRKKKDNVDVRFFYYYFMLAKRKGEVNGTGIGISSLSAKSIAEMHVKLPSVEEQTAISDILDKLILEQNNACTVSENIAEQIELMKKSILAKAFRGELGTNNPEEESSIALLKEMLEKN